MNYVQPKAMKETELGMSKFSFGLQIQCPKYTGGTISIEGSTNDTVYAGYTDDNKTVFGG